MLPSEKIDFDKLVSVVNRLRVLSHPTRLEIIKLLEKNTQLTVTEIYKALNLEQAVTSGHLILMKTHGLLESHKVGVKIFYTIKYQAIEKIIDCINIYND